MGYESIDTLFNEDPSLKERVRKVRKESNKNITVKPTSTPSNAPTYADIVRGTYMKNRKIAAKKDIKQPLNIINPDL